MEFSNSTNGPEADLRKADQPDRANHHPRDQTTRRVPHHRGVRYNIDLRFNKPGSSPGTRRPAFQKQHLNPPAPPIGPKPGETAPAPPASTDAARGERTEEL